MDLKLTNPTVLVGLFIGAMLVMRVLRLHHERCADRCSVHRG